MVDIARIGLILIKSCDHPLAAPVVAGVSGGPDSLCLLDVLHRLGCPVIAAHFDHRLRPDSGEDADAVRAFALRLGVPFALGSADVAAWAREHRQSVEEAARELRYRFLFAEARAFGAAAVATGHTADDQAETVLMHILRGSGLRGLTGMAYRAALPEFDEKVALIRPLLETWREETVQYALERGLPARTDPSNLSAEYARNRVRLELIPYLEQYNPRVKRALWRMADVLKGEERLVEAASAPVFDACLARQGSGWVCLDYERVKAQPPEMVRALILRAAGILRPAMEDIGYEDVERAAAWIQSPSATGGMDWLQGLRLSIERGEGQPLLVLSEGERAAVAGRFPQVVKGVEISLHAPGVTLLGEGWQMQCEVAAPPGLGQVADTGAWEAWLDMDCLAGPPVIRAPRPGDRISPIGMDGHSLKLSDLFVNEKIPRAARPGWPLVTAGGEVAWVPGVRAAHPFRIRAGTRSALHLTLLNI